MATQSSQVASTADAVNNFINKASDGLTTLSHAISQHAPQAWALAAQGVYATGKAQLIVGSLALGLWAIFLAFDAFLISGQA